MAIHTALPIYKEAYELLKLATTITKNMPKDFKASVGGEIRALCVDFVGNVIRPWHTTTRKRNINEATHRIATAKQSDVFAMTNSYLGLIRQATASHHHQAQIANAARRRGFAVKSDLSKIYRSRE